jgi:hypothetical protein
MKVISIKYLEKDETLLFVHVQDEDGTDLMVLPFYHEKEAVKKDIRLQESIDKLPQLLQMIYNTGKENIEVEFETKEVFV